jgi:hypothetical protein
MSGLTAIASKLRHLCKNTKPEIKKISVVYFDVDGTIAWPKNCNDGVLLVPKAMTCEEWENYCSRRLN